MKKIYLAICLLTCSSMVWAQSKVNVTDHAVKRSALVTGFEQSAIDGDGDKEEMDLIGSYMKNDDICQEVILETTYDLQTNSTIMDRLYLDNGYWAASCTFDFATPAGGDDRGSGYAWNEGSGWLANEERIESIRTGWPSLFKTASGREGVIAHGGLGTALSFSYRDNPTDPWTETTVPTAHTEGGLVWNRAAVGGADGNTIHVVALTYPVVFGAPLVNGQDGSLLYWRSTDGGDTWDIQDYNDPSIDVTQFLDFGGDTYTIAAQGDRVCIAVFNGFGDSFFLMSEDNGDSWTKTVFLDSELDLYVVDSGSDTNSDGIADTVLTTDGSGAIHFDQNGTMHMAWGNMRVLDADLSDGNTSFFPGTDGLNYWNEDMVAPMEVAFMQDFDGDDLITLEAGEVVASYGTGLTSMPNFASDDNGTIYLSYSSVNETLLDQDGELKYRHVYVITSTDGGMTWSEPVDVTPFDEEDEIPEIECVYADLLPTIEDGKLSFIYQRDFKPGTTIGANAEDFEEDDNVIVFTQVETDLFVTSLDDNEVESPFSIYPNPVTENFLTVEVDLSAKYTYQLFDILGHEVKAGVIDNMVQYIDVESLKPGVYLITFTEGDSQFSHRVTIK